MSQLFGEDDAVASGGTSGTSGGIAGYADVALERGVDTVAGLTYAVPVSLAGLNVGQRVMVPLGRGNKPVAGYVIRRFAATEQKRVKAILGVDAQAISLTPDLVELARWMAGYYCCPLGMVFSTMLPAAVKHGTGTVTQTMVGMMAGAPVTSPDGVNAETELPGAEAGEKVEGKEEGKEEAKVKLTKLQQAVFDAAGELAAQGHAWHSLRDLADHAGARSISPVKQLIAKGVLAVKEESSVRAAMPLEELASTEKIVTPLQLMKGQRRVIDRIVAEVAAGFNVHLLHGVTGSGKTEVYLRVIEHVLAGETIAGSDKDGDIAGEAELSGAGELPGAGGGAIVLVPEIALTPQTVARFTHRFAHVGVAVLHSGLTAAQRHEQWRRVRQGRVRIVVGARSAVFAPLPHIGVIIVDEEHEPSYKQDQLPRYHARDLAIKRAQLLNIPCLLGSATPSLESYHNATRLPPPPSSTRGGPTTAKRENVFHYHHLSERVAGLVLPTVTIVDLQEERRKRYEYTGRAAGSSGSSGGGGGGGVHLLSIKLEVEIRRTLKAKQQVMLLLNRRGYANYIACPDQRCGWMMQCDYCDATMVYHKDAALPTGGMLRCHHCLAEQLLPELCPVCSRKVTVFGLGTQRVEEEIARKFPEARLARMDSDTMRRAADYHAVLERFRGGQIDVLVGTQMIAKGLDFPNVSLVGVISGDTSLHMPDFRAAERTFQLISQVAGRAGRSAETTAAGLVVVQSFCPDDPSIISASKHDYTGFADRELALRKQVGLPPATRMARIVVRHKDHLKCLEMARKLADHLIAENARMDNAVRLRGPAACPIARIADFHRVQIELIAARAGVIQILLTALRNARLLQSDNHTAVDVDPVALL